MLFIGDDVQAIRSNINLNTGAIVALEIGVGVCAYQRQKSGTGTMTYSRLSGTSTDGSTISTTTGKYTVKTQGLYSITYSAYTRGNTNIYLYKDGAKQDDTMYVSYQPSGDYDQGSNTVVRYIYLLLFILILIIVGNVPDRETGDSFGGNC